MKHLLIIFSLLLTSVSWSKDVNYMDLVIRNGLHYEKFTNELFTGKVVGFEKGYIKAGKIEGEWLENIGGMVNYLKNVFSLMVY